jgi:phage-related protein
VGRDHALMIYRNYVTTHFKINEQNYLHLGMICHTHSDQISALGCFGKERSCRHASGCTGYLRYALHLAQAGGKHSQSKPLKGFGGAGVLEVVENYQGGTYRAVYTVRYPAAVYVLHCFQKKSTQGITTPKPDMDLIHARLKAVAILEKEQT